VRAWRHASAYDVRRGSVAAWLLTIARNVSINMLPARRFDPIDPQDVLALMPVQAGEVSYDEDAAIRSQVRLTIGDPTGELVPTSRRCAI
jgi:RNA polymerase sigma-70 factor (ECF subfamily)